MNSSLAALLAAALCASEGIPPDKAAAIERDQSKAQAEVANKYGNRKQSELSPDERREMMKDAAAAEARVFEQHGVTAKEWATGGNARSRAEQREVTATKKDLADKEKAQKDAADKAAAQKPKAPDEIPVQRGFSDADPVVLDEAPGAAPRVDKGLPPEASADQQAAGGMAEGKPAKDEAKKPAGKHAGGSPKKK